MRTDGELVRELIPEQLRASGGVVDVKILTGDDLVEVLVGKLGEAAGRVADVIGDRDALVRELAEVTDIVAALMNGRGISKMEVADAARAKLQEQGDLGAGTWLISRVPHAIRRYSSANVERQRNRWLPERWTDVFNGYEKAHADLTAHIETAGGVARAYLHEQSRRDPVELFLMTMAWGYQPRDYGPQRTAKVLGQDGAADKIAAIVETTRNEGAAAGWNALLGSHKIRGLGMSFGTKLLYFAGYTSELRPRPLVLDERVRAALSVIAPGTVPAKGLIWQADYLRYLELAEQWAAEPSWNQQPDVVEYALFAHGGG